MSIETEQTVFCCDMDWCGKHDMRPWWVLLGLGWRAWTEEGEMKHSCPKCSGKGADTKMTPSASQGPGDRKQSCHHNSH